MEKDLKGMLSHCTIDEVTINITVNNYGTHSDTVVSGPTLSPAQQKIKDIQDKAKKPSPLTPKNEGPDLDAISGVLKKMEKTPVIADAYGETEIEVPEMEDEGTIHKPNKKGVIVINGKKIQATPLDKREGRHWEIHEIKEVNGRFFARRQTEDGNWTEATDPLEINFDKHEDAT